MGKGVKLEVFDVPELTSGNYISEEASGIKIERPAPYIYGNQTTNCKAEEVGGEEVEEWGGGGVGEFVILYSDDDSEVGEEDEGEGDNDDAGVMLCGECNDVGVLCGHTRFETFIKKIQFFATFCRDD